METYMFANRRMFMKWASAAPFLGYMAAQGFINKAFADSRRDIGNNLPLQASEDFVD